MKSDSLKFWHRERDRLAARVRHGSIAMQKGMEILAVIDERIAEHAHGTIPVDVEELPTEAAPRVAAALPANVMPLRATASQREANRRHAETMQTRAMSAHRAAFERIGRKPPEGDTSAALIRTAATHGQGQGAIGACAPSGLFDWYAERREQALRVCADIRARLTGRRR
jgi:hypothetical protein